jgi:hypothetical protein
LLSGYGSVVLDGISHDDVVVQDLVRGVRVWRDAGVAVAAGGEQTPGANWTSM